MSVTAKQLSRSGARGKDLDSIVREQLQIIDDRLLRHERTWGRNVLSYDLPVIIGLPGLDKKDAQRIVYSSILRSLDRRGFETGILLETDRTTVHIAWMTDLASDEVEAMNALIREKRLTPDEVIQTLPPEQRPKARSLETFLDRGARPAPRAITSVRAGRAKPAPSMTVTAKDQVMRPRGGVGFAATETQPSPSPLSLAEAELLGHH